MYVYYTVEHSTSQMGQFSSFCCWSRHLEVSRQMIFEAMPLPMASLTHFTNTRTGPEKSDLRTLMQAPAVMPRSASLLRMLHPGMLTISISSPGLKLVSGLGKLVSISISSTSLYIANILQYQYNISTVKYNQR